MANEKITIFIRITIEALISNLPSNLLITQIA
uniref:Uncharacterized protein n=1 Tax=Rhizophora mucronata TaxID=61149 RepID=A0A2P2QWV0_RHIMU